MRLLRLPIRLRPSAEGLVLSGWSRKDNFITWDSTLWKREICSQVLRLTDAARCIGLVVIDYTTTPQILRRPLVLVSGIWRVHPQLTSPLKGKE